MAFSSIKVALVFAAAVYAQATPTVTLSQGVVVGTAVPGVNKFLGVPYAAPPARFAVAQPPVRRTTPLIANNLNVSCPQASTGSAALDAAFITPGNSAPVRESEDCLYVNIWAPSTGTTPKAVMFWIYGGNLNFGSGAVPFYDGTSYALNQGVILVNFNYRTNVFGAPGSPAIPLQENNLGLLDQRRALNWVYDNIAAFGGDPNRILIFGESAGGYSVRQLLTYPEPRVPIAAAILESPAAGLARDSRGSWAALVRNLTCTRTTQEAELACVRDPAIPFSRIISFLNSGSAAFSPLPDGKTLALTSIPFIRNQTFARTGPGGASRVPILIGSNSQEAKIVAASTGSSSDLQIATDYLFTCDAEQIARELNANGYNAWRYYFQGVFANTQPTSIPNSGAYHSSEIPIVFGTYPQAGATTAERALSLNMQTKWASFAKTPAAGFPWPKYVGGIITPDLESFGGVDSSTERTIYHLTADYNCGLFVFGLPNVKV